MPKRILQGRVVTKQHNTLSVVVEMKYMHPLYKKIVRKSKKYAVHNPTNSHEVGEMVSMIECRPISKTKKFEILLKQV